jgi:SPP1 gp7 family putative phage head morphogenesis protein
VFNEAIEMDPERIEDFRSWLQREVGFVFLQDDDWIHQYVNEAFHRGRARSMGDVNPRMKLQEQEQFRRGALDTFLRSSFNAPVSSNRVKLLITRAKHEFKGLTDTAEKQVTRELIDGMSIGLSPEMVAKNIAAKIRKLSTKEAATIARTETIRAHAEGQLDGFRELGVDKLGVSVEWTTAGDAKVCKMCSALEGVVVSINEAYGLIPRHPNCRCAFRPANVGEKRTGQKVQRTRILQAIQASLTYDRNNSKWPGRQLLRAAK